MRVAFKIEILKNTSAKKYNKNLQFQLVWGGGGSISEFWAEAPGRTAETVRAVLLTLAGAWKVMQSDESLWHFMCRIPEYAGNRPQ